MGGKRRPAPESAPTGTAEPSFRPAGCVGCTELRERVAWLQTQLEKAQDRLLAVASPQAAAALQGPQPAAPAAAPAPPESFVVEGQSYVVLNGRPVLRQDYDRMLAGQGFLDHDGKFVSVAEHERAMGKLDEMIGCH